MAVAVAAAAVAARPAGRTAHTLVERDEQSARAEQRRGAPKRHWAMCTTRTRGATTRVSELKAPLENHCKEPMGLKRGRAAAWELSMPQQACGLAFYFPCTKYELFWNSQEETGGGCPETKNLFGTALRGHPSL